LVFVGAVAHTSASAAAEASPVRISEAYHDGCPKEPSMLARLESQLGRGHVQAAATDAPAMDLAFRIELRDGVSQGRLTLVVGGASVERTASSRSCEDVVAALAMMAAIAIGEEADLTTPERADEGTPAPSPRKRPRATTKVETERDRPPRRTNEVTASFGAGFEVNGNRGAVFVARWFAQVGFPAAPFHPTMALGLTRSRRERIASPRGAVAVRWTEVSFAACAELVRSGAVRLGPCLNVEAGAFDAIVVAPSPVRSYSYPWLSSGVSAKVVWSLLPELSVEMAAGARAPLVKKELYFEQDRQGVLYRAPVVVPFASAGFVVRLP
jgi:hypothetical protein